MGKVTLKSGDIKIPSLQYVMSLLHVHSGGNVALSVDLKCTTWILLNDDMLAELSGAAVSWVLKNCEEWGCGWLKLAERDLIITEFFGLPTANILNKTGTCTILIIYDDRRGRVPSISDLRAKHERKRKKK